MSIDSQDSKDRGDQLEDSTEEGRRHPDAKLAALLAAFCAVTAASPVRAQEPLPAALVAPAPTPESTVTAATPSSPTKTQALSRLATRLRLGPFAEGGAGAAWDTRDLGPGAARLHARVLAGLALHRPGSRHTGTVAVGWSGDLDRTAESPLEGSGSPDVFEIPVPEHCVFVQGGDRIGFRPDGVRVQPFFATALAIGGCLRPQVAAIVGDKKIGAYPATPAGMIDADLSFGIAVRLLQKEGYQVSLVVSVGSTLGLRIYNAPDQAGNQGTRTDGVFVPMADLGFGLTL